MTKGTKVFEGSGNVFADLGFKDADKLKAKSGLAFQISEIIERRKLTHQHVAKMTGVARPNVTALMNGRHTRFSVAKLMDILRHLGMDVEITVSAAPKSRDTGHIVVKRTRNIQRRKPKAEQKVAA